MMRVEKYEKYDFQPLVRVGYQGMEKRYETMILIFLPIASGHNLTIQGNIPNPHNVRIGIQIGRRLLHAQELIRTENRE